MTTATKLLSACAPSGPDPGDQTWNWFTGTWTAPAGLTAVNITGQGQYGAAENSQVYSYTANFPSYISQYSGNQCFGTDIGGTSAEQQADRNSQISLNNSQLAAVSSSLSSSSWTFVNPFAAGYYMYCTSSGRYLRYISSYWKYLKKIGGTVYWRVSAGYSGNPTTGLGKTFPGGTESSPTPPVQTYNNVAVTPGQSYSLDVKESLRIWWP